MAAPLTVDVVETSDPELRQLVPEGTSPPEDIPESVFAAGLRVFLEGRRLDMQALANDLDISRATLYRRVPDRDALLGAILWFLTRHAIARSIPAGADQRGPDRVVAIVGAFMRDLRDQPAFRRFLDEEPEAALRILTSRAGRVQGPLVASTTRLIEQEVADGTLDAFVDPPTLAYVVVRIGESFLYSDVIADTEPDLTLATAVIRKLLATPGHSPTS